MTAKGAVCLVAPIFTKRRARKSALAGIPAYRPSQAVSSPILLNAVFDTGHPGRVVACVWVFRCYYTGKPKRMFYKARLQSLQGGQPGGPWLPAGCGRAFNHAPRMRHAAMSSYVRTKPFAVIITAVAPDGTREARPAAATVPSGSHSG